MSVLGLWQEESQAFWQGFSPKVIHELLPGKEGHLVLCGCRKNPSIQGLCEGRIHRVDPGITHLRRFHMRECTHEWPWMKTEDVRWVYARARGILTSAHHPRVVRLNILIIPRQQIRSLRELSFPEARGN